MLKLLFYFCDTKSNSSVLNSQTETQAGDRTSALLGSFSQFLAPLLLLGFLDDKDPCHLEEAAGPCRGLVSRYFFDSRSQQCRHFYYGGCFGNANNFRSMAECQAKCPNPGGSI